MSKINNLPYFLPRNLTKEFRNKCKKWDKYLKNVLNPYIKKEINNSKFIKKTKSINTKPSDFIYWIRDFKENAKFWKQPYFIYFDVEKFYPTIDHKILKTNILKLYWKKRWSNIISRDFKKFLKFLDLFLLQSIYQWKWIISWTSLWWYLAEIYLINFFLEIKCHIFRWNDDFILFWKDKKDLLSKFQDINNLFFNKWLRINSLKAKSWKLFVDRFSYLWFEFLSWKNISIKKEKIDIFLKKVEWIFSLKWKEITEKDYTNKIINKMIKLKRLQYWFYYFYRIINTKTIWSYINSKTRKIIRLWLFKNKKEWNSKFIIKNTYLNKLWVINFPIK